MFEDAIISILATLAKQEAVRQSERVRAGLERAKASGKTLGRPKTPEHQVDAVRELRAAGKSLRATAKELGISHTSVVRLGRQGKVPELNTIKNTAACSPRLVRQLRNV